MATVHVTLSTVLGRSSNASSGLLVHSRVRVEATVTATASDAIVADGSVELVAEEGDVWIVTALGADCKCAFGPNPVAGTDPGHYLVTGLPRDFAAVAGDKMSVIAA